MSSDEIKSTWPSVEGKKDKGPTPPYNSNIIVRRILKGHFGKIYSACWSPMSTQDEPRLVSASQDGKLVVWNANSTNKLCAITLKSSWVMACAYGPSASKADASAVVAAGGLDNLVTVYQLDADAKGPPSDSPKCELSSHEGYVSCIQFVDNTRLISASGDSVCVEWDYNSGKALRQYQDAKSDVMSVSINPKNKSVFVSGACDAKARLYDTRSSETPRSFEGHDSDINGTSWMNNGWVFATGSDDSSCMVWDIRLPKNPLVVLNDDKQPSGVTSIDFSKSGRLLLASYDDPVKPVFWDTIAQTKRETTDSTTNKHEERISCIRMSPDGASFITASWDMFLKVWA